MTCCTYFSVERVMRLIFHFWTWLRKQKILQTSWLKGNLLNSGEEATLSQKRSVVPNIRPKLTCNHESKLQNYLQLFANRFLCNLSTQSTFFFAANVCLAWLYYQTLSNSQIFSRSVSCDGLVELFAGLFTPQNVFRMDYILCCALIKKAMFYINW